MGDQRHQSQGEDKPSRQTVPRAGLWLHTFKVSKKAESMTAPELPSAVRVISMAPSEREVHKELLSAVSSVLFPVTQAKARKAFFG